ncbi:HET-domain-containing protein, partial [Lophium mytilinum]
MPCSFKTSEDDRNRFANNYGVSFFNEYGIIAPSYPGFGHSWDFPIRAIDPIISDWSILTDWIHRCEFDHCPCNATPPAASFQIKLIDCMDKSIVIASTSCKYVALSYVWGYGQTVQSPENGVLPTEIPRTISDAVKATISLGYQYLWCDRYCIDQHNITEKQQQIGSMDCIYRNAHITIIAASGEDDDFGLPGVNHTPRILHPEIFLANARLSCAIPDPIHILSKSKWASRAWTYQEALLSKRRLIFTEQCVYFEC